MQMLDALLITGLILCWKYRIRPLFVLATVLRSPRACASSARIEDVTVDAHGTNGRVVQRYANVRTAIISTVFAVQFRTKQSGLDPCPARVNEKQAA